MSTAAQCTPQTDDEYITIVNTTKERYANNPEPAKKRAKERYWFGGGKERAFDSYWFGGGKERAASRYAMNPEPAKKRARDRHHNIVKPATHAIIEVGDYLLPYM